jgi:hypothetical protein
MIVSIENKFYFNYLGSESSVYHPAKDGVCVCRGKIFALVTPFKEWALSVKCTSLRSVSAKWRVLLRFHLTDEGNIGRCVHQADM